jgi:predicted lipoprotein
MKRLTPIVIIALSLLGLGSCRPVEDDDKVTYTDLFENIADNMIVPRYANLQTELLELEERINLYDSSVLSLQLLQNQFATTYHAWQKVSVFEFGPAAEFSALLRSNFNTFPSDVSLIEENVESQDYNLSIPSNYKAKGFPALDYLLFHDVNSVLIAELNEESRMAYIKDCVSDMQLRLDEVVLAWDSYRNTFVGASGNDQNSSLSLLFNQYLYDYEKLKRDKFALPAGFATSFGIPLNADPSYVEAPYSKMSFQLMNANLESLEAIYLGIGEDGVDGIGIIEKLEEHDAQSTVVEGDLSIAIKEQFVICKQVVNSFANDFAFEIEANNSALESASSELQKLVPMLKNDMRSYLSVTVTITDADGD